MQTLFALHSEIFSVSSQIINAAKRHMVGIRCLFSKVSTHIGTGFVDRTPCVFIEFRADTLDNQLDAETGIDCPDRYAPVYHKMRAVIGYGYSVTDLEIPARIHFQFVAIEIDKHSVCMDYLTVFHGNAEELAAFPAAFEAIAEIFLVV